MSVLTLDASRAAMLPQPTGRHRRAGAVLAVAALLLLVVEGWAPRLMGGGDTASRPAPTEAALRPGTDSGVAEAERAGIDVDGAVEQASHTPLPVAGRPGALEVNDERYRAVFDASGFSYAPMGGAGALDLSLQGLERDGAPLPLDVGGWTADAAAAVRHVAPGVTERVTAREGELEWDVVLAAPPAGSGDLVVTSQVDGVAGAPARIGGPDGPAWRFDLADGETVLLDEVVVLDAAGVERHRALPQVDGDEVSLVVPASVLDGAAYPLTVDPTIRGPHTVTEENSSRNPSVAFDGTNYLVVWTQLFGSSNLDIFGARLRGSDGVLVSGPFRISTSDRPESVADVAFDGTNFLVVWELQFGTSSDWDVKGQRVSKLGGGGLLGGNFNIDSAGANSREVAVAALPGSGWLVVWEDNRFASATPVADPLAILGRWVTKDGAVNANVAPLRLNNNAKRDDDADVTWNGSNFLVAWTHYFDPNATPADHDVLAQRVGPGPSIFLSGVNFPISQPNGIQTTPALASDGSRSLAVWTDNRFGDFQAFGSLVDSAAGVTANFPISNKARHRGAEAVAFYNGAYLVTWINEKTAGSNTYNINGARVTTGGSVRDGNGFLVAADTNFFNRPALARGVDGEWGVAYSFFNFPDQAVRLRRVLNNK